MGTRKTLFIARLSVLVAITFAVEMLGLPQPITGPLVNFFIILTTLVLGPLSGITLGALTPILALLRGQLPAILAILVPFIMVGNALLVVGFYLVRMAFLHPVKYRQNDLLVVSSWLAIISGAVLKFIWLTGAVKVILPVIFNVHLNNKFVAAMMLPQLITAMIGAVLALMVYALLLKRYILLTPKAD